MTGASCSTPLHVLGFLLRFLRAVQCCTNASYCVHSSKKLGDLLSYARVKPAVNQIESHPFWRNEKTIDFCHSNVRALW